MEEEERLLMEASELQSRIARLRTEIELALARRAERVTRYQLTQLTPPPDGDDVTADRPIAPNRRK